MVYSANYTPKSSRPQNSIKVAVKTAKVDISEQNKKDMLREISVMSNLVHPNIVRLYGVFEHGNSPSIVLEYLPHGDLKSYLAVSQQSLINRNEDVNNEWNPITSYFDINIYLIM